MTDNKKLLKEFSNIYSSCNKAKQGALAEIGKIDEKYRRLAEEEKKQLTELVKALEAQMEMYGNYLGLTKKTEDAPAVVEEEEKIEDTIFPENNENEPEQEETKEEEKAEPVEEKPVEEKAADEFSDVWPEETEDLPAGDEKKEDEDEWPAFPEEWK